MDSLPLLLGTVALVAFGASLLLVKRVLRLQATQLQKERIKARVGVANDYVKQQTSYSGCWWCSLGRALGPKSAKEIATIQRYLVSAGYRHERYIGAYYFIKYLAVLLSGVLMFRYMGWTEASDLIEAAFEKTIRQKRVTYDLHRLMEGAVELKTSEFGTAIIENMGELL